MRHESTVQKRLVKAVLAVLAIGVLFTALLATDAWKTAQANNAASSRTTNTQSVWEMVKGGKDISAALAALGYAEMSYEDYPAWFEQEITDKTIADRAFANQDASLIYLLLHHNAQMATAQLLDALETRGWTTKQSGQENVYTAIKEEGTCRWLMAELDPIGEETSVVLHIGRT